MKTCPYCQRSVSDFIMICECGYSFNYTNKPEKESSKSKPTKKSSLLNLLNVCGALMVIVGIFTSYIMLFLGLVTLVMAYFVNRSAEK